MKLLVVDDSESDRNAIRSNFEAHGWEVVEAPDGRQGLDSAAADRPDLIICECLLPAIDGFTLLHELRKAPALKSVPFVFYSVYNDSSELELAQSLGASAFLEKPKSPDQLWEEVELVLDETNVARDGGSGELLQDDEFQSRRCPVLSGMLEKKVRELGERNESLSRRNAELETKVAEGKSQLQEAMRELEEFAYSVSHDLRAPLRHIDGFSQALADDHAANLEPMGKAYLDRVRTSTKRMIEMMEAILQLSRHSRVEMVIDTVDLSAMAKEVAAELERSQPERKVRFEIADGMVVRGDAKLLRVVVEHLLGNAWKFTGPTEAPVIEFFPTEWDGQVAYSVRDNGVGFDSNYTGKLFSPFQRLHTQQEFPGVGMGLATVRKIISRHGGKVRADSELGKGATFTFAV